MGIRGWWRDQSGYVRGREREDGGGCVPEKIRMVSIPERKLDSASSCGGLGVVDREGMGVMDLENPFSLWSFDSAREGESSRSIRGRSWEERGRSQRKAQNGKGCRRTSTYFLPRRVFLASYDGDERRVW